MTVTISTASLVRADLRQIADDLDTIARLLRELRDLPPEHAQIIAARYARDIELIARQARGCAAMPESFRN